MDLTKRDTGAETVTIVFSSSLSSLAKFWAILERELIGYGKRRKPL